MIAVNKVYRVKLRGEINLDFTATLIEIIFHCGQCGDPWTEPHECSGPWAGIRSQDYGRCGMQDAEYLFSNGVRVGPAWAIPLLDVTEL
jgi:hypothetical protein